MNTRNYVPYSIGIVILISLVSVCIQAQQPSKQVPGPYYALPSWDQQLFGSARFVVLSNWGGGAAVLDKETGLVWERSPSSEEMMWYVAENHCQNLVLGNRLGWRLPKVQELASLVDPSITTYPTIRLPAGHPFQNLQQVYWSATSRAYSTEVAWVVLFVNTGGDVVTAGAKAGNGWAWCVRGGGGLDVE